MSTLTRPQPRSVSPARWARLRLVSDDGLLRLIRQGDECAFDVLVRRYDAPIFAFCKHMLGSREDAEDVMQETWSAAHRAMIRDDRELTIRAWLYAIARNRCLNAMRTSGPRPTLVPVDVIDESTVGSLYQLPVAGSAADSLDDRERFRILIGDIQELPENQRTALVLYELDALSYDEIAGVLNVSVGAVKSLLVRARVGLTECAEAREIDCDDVRLELASVAQRVTKLRSSSKAHLRHCDDCARFGSRLKTTGRSLTAAMSPAPIVLLWLQKIGIAKLWGGGGIAAGSAAGTSAGGVIGAGGGAFALKAAATVAAAGLATAGASEVHQLAETSHKPAKSIPASIASQPAATPGPVVAKASKTTSSASAVHHKGGSRTALAGVSVSPISKAATASVGSKTTRATTAAGGLRVAAVPKHQPTSGRPEVQQAQPTPVGRPTVSGADTPPSTTAAAPDSSTSSGSTAAPTGDATPAPDAPAG